MIPFEYNIIRNNEQEFWQKWLHNSQILNRLYQSSLKYIDNNNYLIAGIHSEKDIPYLIKIDEKGNIDSTLGLKYIEGIGNIVNMLLKNQTVLIRNVLC